MHNPSKRPGRIDYAVWIDAAVPSFHSSVLGNREEFPYMQRRFHVDLLHALRANSFGRADQLKGAVKEVCKARSNCLRRTGEK